jgi:hypothetical protein
LRILRILNFRGIGYYNLQPAREETIAAAVESTVRSCELVQYAG